MSASIPVWVPAILVGLLAIGYRQAQPRLVAPATVTTIAVAMFVFSLYGVCAAFGANPVPLVAWSAGLATSVALGGRIFGPHGLSRAGASVRVPGSWLPLWLMLGIFAAKFILGFAHGIGSRIVTEVWFMATASLAFGLLSGGFAARALVVHRFASRRDDAAVRVSALESASI